VRLSLRHKAPPKRAAREYVTSCCLCRPNNLATSRPKVRGSSVVRVTCIRLLRVLCTL